MVEPEPLDLTSEQPTEDQLITLPQRDYNPPAAHAAVETDRAEMLREQMRGRIAFALVSLLVLIVVFTLFLTFASLKLATDFSSVIQAVGTTVLTPIIGLIGAVT